MSVLTTNNVWTGTQDFKSTVTLESAVILIPQTFVEAAGTFGTITLAGGSVVEVTGVTAGGTLLLPSAPVLGLQYDIRNNGTATFTLSGNGKNIDGLATQALSSTSSATVLYDGTQWIAISNASWLVATFNANTSFNASATFNSRLILLAQAFLIAGGTQTVASGGGPRVLITGSTAASTIALPNTSLVTGMVLYIVNNASVAITLSGNGANISGVATLTMNAISSRTVCYNGATWDLISSVG